MLGYVQELTFSWEAMSPFYFIFLFQSFRVLRGLSGLKVPQSFFFSLHSVNTVIELNFCNLHILECLKWSKWKLITNFELPDLKKHIHFQIYHMSKVWKKTRRWSWPHIFENYHKPVLTKSARFLTLGTFNIHISVSQACLDHFMGVLTLFLMELWQYFRAVAMTSRMTTW